jgi:Universal stress protein family
MTRTTQRSAWQRTPAAVSDTPCSAASPRKLCGPWMCLPCWWDLTAQRPCGPTARSRSVSTDRRPPSQSYPSPGVGAGARDSHCPGACLPPARCRNRRASRSSVRGAAEQLRAGVEAEVRVVRGQSAHSVVRAVHAVDPAMVALATHGRTGLARVVLGSVATAVVRGSRCPALVVRPAASTLASGRVS